MHITTYIIDYRGISVERIEGVHHPVTCLSSSSSNFILQGNDVPVVQDHNITGYTFCLCSNEELDWVLSLQQYYL